MGRASPIPQVVSKSTVVLRNVTREAFQASAGALETAPYPGAGAFPGDFEETIGQQNTPPPLPRPIMCTIHAILWNRV